MRLALALLLCASSASATTYTVTDTADPGDGTCDASCTLREAIVAANAGGGSDPIEFNIPGGGPHLITLASALPALTDLAGIDGTTETGTVCCTLTSNRPDCSSAAWMIRIDASAIDDADAGIELQGAGATLKGVEVFGAETLTEYNVQLNGDGQTVTCVRAHGRRGGIIAVSNGNTIGGSTAGSANWTTGAAVGGVTILGDDNVVAGNLSGTNADGSAAYGTPNEKCVYVEAGDGNTVGGATTAHGNIASGCSATGVEIKTGVSGTSVQHNLIGVGADGTTEVCNGDETADQLVDDGTGTTTSDNTLGDCDPAAACCGVDGSGGVTCVDPTNIGPIASQADCEAVVDGFLGPGHVTSFNGTTNCVGGAPVGTCPAVATPTPGSSSGAMTLQPMVLRPMVLEPMRLRKIP